MVKSSLCRVLSGQAADQNTGMGSLHKNNKIIFHSGFPDKLIEEIGDVVPLIFFQHDHAVCRLGQFHVLLIGFLQQKDAFQYGFFLGSHGKNAVFLRKGISVRGIQRDLDLVAVLNREGVGLAGFELTGGSQDRQKEGRNR